MQVNNYIPADIQSGGEKLLGSDVLGETKNYYISGIQSYIQDNIVIPVSASEIVSTSGNVQSDLDALNIEVADVRDIAETAYSSANMALTQLETTVSVDQNYKIDPSYLYPLSASEVITNYESGLSDVQEDLNELYTYTPIRYYNLQDSGTVGEFVYTDFYTIPNNGSGSITFTGIGAESSDDPKLTIKDDIGGDFLYDLQASTSAISLQQDNKMWFIKICRHSDYMLIAYVRDKIYTIVKKDLSAISINISLGRYSGVGSMQTLVIYRIDIEP
jgi:hypothetical protein